MTQFGEPVPLGYQLQVSCRSNKEKREPVRFSQITHRRDKTM